MVDGCELPPTAGSIRGASWSFIFWFLHSMPFQPEAWRGVVACDLRETSRWDEMKKKETLTHMHGQSTLRMQGKAVRSAARATNCRQTDRDTKSRPPEDSTCRAQRGTSAVMQLERHRSHRATTKQSKTYSLLCACIMSIMVQGVISMSFTRPERIATIMAASKDAAFSSAPLIYTCPAAFNKSCSIAYHAETSTRVHPTGSCNSTASPRNIRQQIFPMT